ncbi:MAG: hypothetical protein ABIQ40_16685 [Bacteroidia bacterium]
MKTADFSKEIYERYFGRSSGIVMVTLRDKTELAGKFTGFFRGENEFDEPYIVMWRFVDEKEFVEIDFLPYPNQEVGCIIKQKNILAVRFK